MTLGQASFHASLELLDAFLSRREAIVEHIQGVLNAQRKPVEYLADAPRLGRYLEDAFFIGAGVTESQARLRGQLEEAHWAGGFTPSDLPGLHNGLIDPGELMVRGFFLWQQTRWPGRNGRVRYAHTLFNLYILRQLALLSMRLWDDGPAGADDRLSRIQGALDRLWSTSPGDQPRLVRDARWLIPLAQSPATDDLGVYFDVAARIADTLSEKNRLEIHKAGICMAAGHLRSQLHYYATRRGVPLDELALVSNARTTNALDYALLIQELVPLLEAYARAVDSGDGDARRELAAVICQGISPDPELFVNRVELLGAYSTIEHLFVTTDGEGQAGYTPMGRRHIQLVEAYQARIAQAATLLLEDCAHLRPAAGAYSPYGAIYGFSSDLIEHMALRTLAPDAVAELGLENVFAGGDASRRAWVTGWRKLPHVPREVQKQFDYPQQFADAIFARLEQALRRRAADVRANAGTATGRLFVLPADSEADGQTSVTADLPVQYIRSSDRSLVAARRAEAQDESQLLSDRREGRCLLSYKTPGDWVAISKAVLTEVLGAGRDARLAGLPPATVGLLRLMYPALVARSENASRR